MTRRAPRITIDDRLQLTLIASQQLAGILVDLHGLVAPATLPPSLAAAFQAAGEQLSRRPPSLFAPAAVGQLYLGNDELMERYLRAMGLRWSPQTVRVGTQQLSTIARQLAPTRLVDVTEEDLIAWREQLTGSPSQS